MPFTLSLHGCLVLTTLQKASLSSPHIICLLGARILDTARTSALVLML